MRKSTAFWMSLACFGLGVAWGFLVAPIKKGISIYVCNNGNNNRSNGNGNGNGWDQDEEAYEEDDFLSD